MTDTIPNPGSKEAIEQRCICPVIDNHYGAGFGDPLKFWITGGCPVHAPGQADTSGDGAKNES